MIGKRPADKAAVQLIGWQPDRKILVDTHYDAKGGYSEIEYTEIDELHLRGKFVKNWDPEDGDQKGATIVVTKENDDLASVVITSKNKSGEVSERRLKFRRKK